MGKKHLKDLTLKDNFVFSAVMMEENNCRRLLEIALGFPIERVEVIKEKSVVYHPEYKGIRLDVYAKDENNTRYNVEMQVAKKKDYQMHTLFLFVTLIPLAKENIVTLLQDNVKKILQMSM